MAIPAIPTNLYVQTANRQVFLSWDLETGATSYSVERSTDGVNYSVVASPAVPNYLDTSVSVGVQYYYQVASSNISGTSAYTSPQTIIPVPTGEMSLGQIRLNSQQTADRVDSNFVTLPEWNNMIRLASEELYDLLITVYEDYFLAPPVQFVTTQSQGTYPLPDGTSIYTVNGQNAAPFYKLAGVDLGINSANNAYVTMSKFNFIDRNRYVYPNTASTIYGVFNMQYRVMGSNILFIPVPSNNQPIQLWYYPRLKELLQDTDITDYSISGWIRYVIVRAAKYALDKEESDTTKLDAELLFLKGRIEESASNRDAGQPDKISDIRTNGMWGSLSGGYGWNGPLGGF